MSEYRIVNRVAPTPAMAQTIAEVEAQAELEKAIPLVKEVIQNPGVLEGLKTEYHIPFVPRVGENVAFSPESREAYVASVKPSAANVAAVLTSQRESFELDDPELDLMLKIIQDIPESKLNSYVSSEEFEQFKQKVIQAFKHAGFDTRNFDE